MLLLFSLTIFLGAGLLFAVQPMFGRMLLPLLGGAPAVWNTSLVFFQATLLAGYGYAHWLSTRWSPKRQCVVHAAVLVLALVSLPIAIPRGWTPPTDHTPVGWLLVTAMVAVGLPFLAVSATSPLLQRWLSLTRHPAARDPYFLYAASNLGSLLALVSYPVLIEPRLGLVQQSRAWAVGYGLLVGLLLACAGVIWRLCGHAPAETPTQVARPGTGDDTVATPAAARRLRWVLLAFGPSSLMLSVTNYISLDLAAIPLLWVIPLTIYLATFSLAFARRRWLSAARSARLFRLLLVLVVITLAVRASEPIAVLIVLHLTGLFAAGLACHNALADDRPAPRFLTEFYFWVALGGVLGGVFNALLAPLLFRSVLEYPLGLVLVCLLLPRTGSADESGQQRIRDWLWPLGLVAVSVALVLGVSGRPLLAGTVAGRLLVFGVPAVVAFSFSRRPRRYALGLVALLVAGGLYERQGGRVLFAERSFFGIHRVLADASGQSHRLFHGTTVHGIQRREPALRGEPLAYYTRSGPVGQIMQARGAAGRQVVALVGLGSGALAGHAAGGERWTFYEIDPAVERIARDPRLFSYLADSEAELAVVLGDARLTLARASDAQYQTIVLDAYNSDAIPLHLITREALQLYGRKLAADGVVAWHITNRHLDLEPVLAALARDAGWVCRVRHDADVSAEEAALGKAPSRWAVMARDASSLGALTADGRWQPAREQSAVGVWTDDYANLFRVLIWGRE